MEDDRWCFESVLGQELKYSEYKLNSDFASGNNSLFLDFLKLHFEEHIVVITPNNDIDEIEVEIFLKDEQTTPQLSSSNFFPDEFTGSRLGYTWQGINTNGYSDVLIFAFNNLIPSMLVLCEGSCLKILKVISP